MKFKTLLVINAALAAAFGLALVFVPGRVTLTFGITADVGMRYMGQLFGSCLVGIAVMCWFAKETPESDARTAIFRALFAFNGVAFIVSLVAQLEGVMNARGWSTVVIYLFLALGWVYFLWAKPAA